MGGTALPRACGMPSISGRTRAVGETCRGRDLCPEQACSKAHGTGEQEGSAVVQASGWARHSLRTDTLNAWVLCGGACLAGWEQLARGPDRVSAPLNSHSNCGKWP